MSRNLKQSCPKCCYSKEQPLRISNTGRSVLAGAVVCDERIYFWSRTFAKPPSTFPFYFYQISVILQARFSGELLLL